jgi:tripartite-type tricarboxylate transporter receptor subunit TctC
MKTRHLFGCGLALLLAFAASVAAAQSYPANRVTILTSFPPGGGTDFLARLVAQKLNEKWGRPVVVENRVGGNGIVGARAAAAAPADGHTLYMGSSNHMVMLPAVYEKAPFDPLKDFVPVMPIGSQSFVLTVHPSLPARSVSELVAYAKSRPGELNYAAPGIGGIEHLSAVVLQNRTGIRMVHIPYKGSADGLTAVLSGEQVGLTFASISSATPHIRSGRLRALANTAPKRSPALPDVPTATEAGLGDFVMLSWNGIFAPAGTPPEIVKQLHADLRHLLTLPDVTQRLSAVGVEPMGGSPEEFAALIKFELARWRAVVKEAGIELVKLQ